MSLPFLCLGTSNALDELEIARQTPLDAHILLSQRRKGGINCNQLGDKDQLTDLFSQWLESPTSPAMSSSPSSPPLAPNPTSLPT